MCAGCVLWCAHSRRRWYHQGRQSAWVGDVEEVGDIQEQRREAVKDTNRPSLLGKAPVPRADVALHVEVRLRVAGVPEEPDVLLI
jgi:hypothetical protein